jgi:succinoglycan biosynthesis transport protein ExoP
MTLRQFWLVLKARHRLVLGIFGAFVIVALVIAFILPKQYTGNASVIVDFKPAPDSAGNVAAQITAASYMATQVDIITSPRVAERTSKILRLADAPQYKQEWQDSTGGRGDVDIYIGELLRKKLVVTPSRDSNVIDISATVRDPKFSAILANAFAQGYIETLIELKVDAAKRYSVWFDERSQALRKDVEEKQKRLAEFERTTGIVPSPSDGRMDYENARLTQLTQQLATIQALRQDSQSRQRQANGDYESMPEVLQSPVISELKSELAKAETKMRDIAANSGKNYPDYQSAAAEVAGLKERIAQESRQIAESLGATTQVNVRRENEMVEAIAAQKKRMQEMTRQNDEATILQNDVIAGQKNLDAVTQRLAQSSLEGATQQTNVSLLTPAVEPLNKSSPKRGVILLVGAFLGALIGCIAAVSREMSDRRIRQNEELVQLLGVPLLANIGRARVDGNTPRSPNSPRLAGAELPSV